MVFCIKLKLCIDVLDFEDKNYNGRQLPIFFIADIYHSNFCFQFLTFDPVEKTPIL